MAYYELWLPSDWLPYIIKFTVLTKLLSFSTTFHKNAITRQSSERVRELYLAYELPVMPLPRNSSFITSFIGQILESVLLFFQKKRKDHALSVKSEEKHVSVQSKVHSLLLKQEKNVYCIFRSHLFALKFLMPPLIIISALVFSFCFRIGDGKAASGLLLLNLIWNTYKHYDALTKYRSVALGFQDLINKSRQLKQDANSSSPLAWAEVAQVYQLKNDTDGQFYIPFLAYQLGHLLYGSGQLSLRHKNDNNNNKKNNKNNSKNPLITQHHYPDSLSSEEFEDGERPKNE